MMHLIKARTFPRLKQVVTRLNYSTVQAPLVDENEYTEKPIYPPILDMSLEARKRRNRQKTYDNIKALNTVEEKQIALNMPRYYGFKCVSLNETRVPYNALPLVQHYTKSHLKITDKLPDIYNETSQVADLVVQDIKSLVEDSILIENEGVERNIVTTVEKPEQTQKVDASAQNIVKQINRIISNNLTDRVSHILSAQVDFDPRHEAFWFVGGVPVPPTVKKWRKQFHWMKYRLDEEVDRPVQYIGTPLMTLRHQLPLKPIVPYSEAENPEFKVPKFSYHPENVGYTYAHRHGTNIPGYWPGDLDEFGLLSYHGTGHIFDRLPTFGEEDNLETLHCQAIKASFGWLLAQANYQGFTTYNDITYPLVTQTVLTNGKDFSFYLYQLNTIAMNIDEIDSPKHNLCFAMKPTKLYDTIEDGKVKGLNDGVLKMLVQLYLNEPEKRDHDMKPYLGKEEQFVADIEDDQKRCWLENRYKQLVANRPRHLLVPEVYNWEQIYKIQHKTRFFEARRRPFELDINPMQRRLDEHLPTYIPKVLRPYPRHKKKFETTYYPKV
ncbi:28S ribosomal protein S30, mitochondrial [Aricia agestis]|uniref:28S ribosomal protein S30, mitochondrial n=1 Tax=Aricia agestis TaxID=91739 RepID=UPI001C203917|nr:28S ribosomal protein S30, mitochondrial [Aricia agestis]